MLKRVLLAWSSGKDSAWALHALSQDPEVEVVGLLTTLNSAVDRVAMHGVRRSLLEAQAKAAELPLLTVPLPFPCPNEEYERLMSDATAKAKRDGVTHIAFGDLFLEDVRDYRIRQLTGSGVEPLFPIWSSVDATPSLAREMIGGETRAIIACVDSKQLDPDFLGREYDQRLLDELPASVDPCGERGEFHTFCYDSPAFDRALSVKTGERVVRDQFHYIDVIAAD